MCHATPAGRALPTLGVGLGLLLAQLTAGTALADRVHLTNGNYLEGTAHELESGEIQITSALGTFTLPPSSVARVERTTTVEQEVEKALEELETVDAESLWRLALWSADQGALTLARRLQQEVVRLDPEHDAARRALGYRRFEDRWVTEEEYHELRGEVQFRGEWVTRTERASLVEIEALAARAEAERRRDAAQQAALQEQIERLSQETKYDRGIPYYPYGYGGIVYPPPVVTPPIAPPVVRPPTRPPQPPTQPPPSAPRHHTGRFRTPG